MLRVTMAVSQMCAGGGVSDAGGICRKVRGKTSGRGCRRRDEEARGSDAQSCWDSRARPTSFGLKASRARCFLSFPRSLALPCSRGAVVAGYECVTHAGEKKAKVTPDAITTWVTEDGLVTLEGWRDGTARPPGGGNGYCVNKQTKDPVFQQHLKHHHLAALFIKEELKKSSKNNPMCCHSSAFCGRDYLGKSGNYIMIIYLNTFITFTRKVPI